MNRSLRLKRRREPKRPSTPCIFIDLTNFVFVFASGFEELQLEAPKPSH